MENILNSNKTNELNNDLEKESINEEMAEEGKQKKNKKHNKIRIDMNAIPCVEVEQQESELRHLGITAFDQSVYEENVMLQMDKHMDELNGSQSDTNEYKQINTNTKCFPQICDNQIQYKDFKKTFYNELNETNDRLSDCEEVYDEEEEEWKPSDGEYETDEHMDLNDDIEVICSDEEIQLNNKCINESKVTKNKPKVAKRTVRKKVTDDGSDRHYQKRIKEYKKQKLIEKHQNILPDGTEIKNLDEMVKLDNGFQIPKRIWEQLFPYQQTGVKWLWELHQLGCGGIVGDEMGLGKTIQMIAFLCGLSCSRFHSFRDLYTSLGPVILVCPATVMHQWVAEFHKWWPYCRVAVLHQTGSHTGKKETLIKAINKSNGILITSYAGVYSYHKCLLRHDWHYVILDEGHKIRNPDAQITHSCKMFSTPHRIILSGSPIQNNLRELWSLFDFIYPGKLGTLPVFMEHFAVPITQGGYANATEVQIQVAFKMATVLRDSIKPYLLRRMKDEVKSSLTLPSKNEQVLFCKLTDEQRELYKSYLDSSTVRDIMRGSTQIFVGLINLRKICNHPNLFSKSVNQTNNDFGYYKMSGKMIVVNALLRIWQNQRHKVLLFTQSRQMIKILEKFLNYRSYSYLKMDGTTSVQTRQPLIKQFNEDPNIFVFLLTTRVGGIGVNLTGANRVLIYDPDWNPSTDVQARERCWRIGQNKSVTIYRLLSVGTVEEKIYHRQIFKQYLTNRVLKDPKQRRFFKTNDLHELFTLGSISNTTESSAIFAGTDSEVKVNPNAKRHKSRDLDERNESTNKSESQLSPKKIEELRNRAKAISKMISQKFSNINTDNSKNESDKNESQVVITTDTNTSNDGLASKYKKQKKGTKFEGKRIKYLVKQDIYKEKGLEKETNSEDEYVLKKLFKKSKVQSALQHDIIECTSSPDFMLAEKEAEIVAKQAISALKRSRELCFSGQPSVNPLSRLKYISTNRKFGQKRKLSNESESDPTSSSLINNIKTRNIYQNEINLDSEENSSEVNSISMNSEFDALLADIRHFIAFQSNSSSGNRGEATTQEVLDAFKSKLPAHQSAVFKSMLYQLCDFYRRPDKVGVWKLKVEFR